MKNITRRKQRKSRRRKQRGGNLDCEKEGFTREMREAGFGVGYGIQTGIIHGDGETWTYDRLKDFSYRGMVKWWSDKLGNSEDDYRQLEVNETLAILGAFYHRYKIVAEQYNKANANLQAGLKRFIPSASSASYKEPPARLAPQIKSLLPRLDAYATSEVPIYLHMEQAIDRAQCIMFYIVKHKGKLPPGFEMDPRIEARAREEIRINKIPGILENPTAMAIEPTLKWLDFVKKEYEELGSPPVTFKVMS